MDFGLWISSSSSSWWWWSFSSSSFLILILIVIVVVVIMAFRHIPTMIKTYHGGNLSVMNMVGIRWWQNPTIDNDNDEVGLGGRLVKRLEKSVSEYVNGTLELFWSYPPCHCALHCRMLPLEGVADKSKYQSLITLSLFSFNHKINMSSISIWKNQFRGDIGSSEIGRWMKIVTCVD